MAIFCPQKPGYSLQFLAALWDFRCYPYRSGVLDGHRANHPYDVRLFANHFGYA